MTATKYSVGDRAYWVHGKVWGTVTAVRNGGEYDFTPDGAFCPTRTRAVFLSRTN